MSEKPTKRQQKYWDKILSQHDLGLDRGRAGKATNGGRRLVYVGDGNDVLRIESQNVAKAFGRKKPKKQAD